MNYYETPSSVIESPVTDRATFIRRTYGHLAGALLAFIAIEALILNSPLAPALTNLMLGGRFTWLIVLGLFMLVAHIANRWAVSAVSKNTQYMGLGLYVLAEAVIFAPLLLIATRFDPMIIVRAGLITSGLFLGLTWVAFTTRKDFSFLGGIVKVGFMIALGVIVASILFGFSLGLVFSFIMVALLGVSVLYQTSNVMHHYHTEQYVAAALGLFASFATMLWYVIQILLSFSSRD